jgi:polygalacturonase
MKKFLTFLILIFGFSQNAFMQENNKDLFPDGTKIPDWFLKTTKVQLNKLGKQYVITNYGATNDSMAIQTKAIQNTINKAAKQGGGVIVIPKGVYLSGALFFKPKTHLYLSEGAVLKGSDNIADYPIKPSRMEGQNLDYYSALVNAYGVDGFTISGKGTINGNGLKYWNAFWQRRKENPKCTNLEVSRPRLVFIWKCKNVQMQDVKLINSGFWTNHFYQCSNVKMIDLYIYSPASPVKAPSTDGVDIDICSNFLIKGCYIAVNDDAISLKGGKGPWADKDSRNGANTNIIIENSEFGFSHSTLTCGSESIHDRNVLLRNCKVNGPQRLLWFKMRPDTPQNYEFVTVENVEGEARSFLDIKPWKQFFDLKGRKDLPVSICRNVTLRNINFKCETFFDVKPSDKYKLSNFTFQNLNIQAAKGSIDKSLINRFTLKNVKVNNALVE